MPLPCLTHTCFFLCSVNKYDPPLFNIQVLQLFSQLQQTLIPFFKKSLICLSSALFFFQGFRLDARLEALSRGPSILGYFSGSTWQLCRRGPVPCVDIKDSSFRKLTRTHLFVVTGFYTLMKNVLGSYKWCVCVYTLLHFCS